MNFFTILTKFASSQLVSWLLELSATKILFY